MVDDYYDDFENVGIVIRDPRGNHYNVNGFWKDDNLMSNFNAAYVEVDGTIVDHADSTYSGMMKLYDSAMQIDMGWKIKTTLADGVHNVHYYVSGKLYSFGLSSGELSVGTLFTSENKKGKIFAKENNMYLYEPITDPLEAGDVIDGLYTVASANVSGSYDEVFRHDLVYVKYDDVKERIKTLLLREKALTTDKEIKEIGDLFYEIGKMLEYANKCDYDNALAYYETVRDHLEALESDLGIS